LDVTAAAAMRPSGFGRAERSVFRWSGCCVWFGSGGNMPWAKRKGPSPSCGFLWGARWRSGDLVGWGLASPWVRGVSAVWSERRRGRGRFGGFTVGYLTSGVFGCQGSVPGAGWGLVCRWLITKFSWVDLQFCTDENPRCLSGLSLGTWVGRGILRLQVDVAAVRFACSLFSGGSTCHPVWCVLPSSR
jgi:hypothetical protein